ncbi:HNHc domain containing protein [uncultured Caudovirales phage]|uniref:HNHc domain containing protein n=1 Tax=uncultured Caudovirales phage TaxID=2100421 RepID=A0A6J7WFT1_9CAUD|nr:HNHc domain containing protein [uncultured Caudovirales phage]
MAMTKEERNAKDREYYQLNKEKLREKKLKLRIKNIEKVRSRARELYAINKEKNKIKYDMTKERKSAYHKKYREENKEKLAAKKIDWYKKNKEVITLKINLYKEKNKEKILQQKKNYRENNPEKILADCAKRRASRIQRTPCWLTDKCLKKIETIYAKAKKLEEKTGIKHHVDHIIPLQGKLVSGLHVPSNLRVVTAKENISKNNKYHVN